MGVRSRRRVQDRLLCGLQKLHVLTVCRDSRLGVFSLWSFSFEPRRTDSDQVEERRDGPPTSCRRTEPHFLPLLFFCLLDFESLKWAFQNLLASRVCYVTLELYLDGANKCTQRKIIRVKSRNSHKDQLTSFTELKMRTSPPDQRVEM